MVKNDLYKSDEQKTVKLDEVLSGSKEELAEMESGIQTYINYNTLQSRLKFVFSECGKSQRAIAHAIGITPQSLGQWAKTGRASRKHLFKMASFLNISTMWLIDDIEASVPSMGIIGQRLKAKRQHEGVTLMQVADYINTYIQREIGRTHEIYTIPAKVIALVEEGTMPLSGHAASALMHFYRLEDIRELIGKTSQNPFARYGKEEKLVKHYALSRDAFKKIDKLNWKSDDTYYFTKKPYIKRDPAETIDIPYINEVQRDNEPALSESFSISWLKSKGFNQDRLVLVSCNDDSMMPRVNNDDIVLIDRDYKNILSGKIYAINYAGEPIIRRLSKKFDGSLIIQAENGDYPSEEVTAEQAQALDIIGRAVWHAGPL